MATQRYISTSFWEDAWIRSLDPAERYLYMYLLTNPLTNISGVYEITIDRIAFDTGYDERTLRPMFERFAESKKAFYIDENWLVLPSWPHHQKWQVRSKIKTGIERSLCELPEAIFEALPGLGYRYPIHTLSIPYAYPSNYSDTDTEGEPDPKREGDPDPEWEEEGTIVDQFNHKTGRASS